MFIKEKLFEEVIKSTGQGTIENPICITADLMVKLFEMGAHTRGLGRCDGGSYFVEVEFSGCRFKAEDSNSILNRISKSEKMPAERRNEIAYKILLYQGFGGMSLSKIERRTLPNLAKSLSGNISEDELKVFFFGLYSDVFDLNFGN
jgi:hypothetical protein